MKAFKIIIPIFIGTLIYSILGFCVGPRGLWPMSQISSQKTLISRNLEVLYSLNQDLEARLQNLTSDPDTISVYAHELGYVADGEQLIKLSGFTGGIERNLAAGNVVMLPEPEYLPEWLCKLLGLFAGITSFFGLSFLFWGKRHVFA